MNKLIVLSGVPGSGKSYFSNTVMKVFNSHVYIISSDDLRRKIAGNQSDLSQDNIMWPMFYDLAKVYSQDKNGIVILDSTNIAREYRIGCTKVLKPLFDETDLVLFNPNKDVAMNQNLQREYPIAPDVLEKYFEIFEMPNEEDEAFFDHVVVVENNNIAKAIEMVQKNTPTLKRL